MFVRPLGHHKYPSALEPLERYIYKFDAYDRISCMIKEKPINNAITITNEIAIAAIRYRTCGPRSYEFSMFVSIVS